MAMPKCLVPDCNNKAAAGCSGQCMRCWSGSKKEIAAGRTTLEELETLGLVTIPKTPLQLAIERKREEHAAGQ